MDLGLAGKTAVVTGGSRGIGLAVAEALAAEGCALHLAARTPADLDAARAKILARHNVTVAVHTCDLADGAAQRALAAACPEADILVNNAGAIPGGGIEQVDEATWRRAWDLKVFGYVNLTREVYGAMRARGRGVIVNVIGLAGEQPNADYIAGSAGNASLMAFTRALGGTSVEHGVRVVGVNPGLVATERAVTLLKGRAAKRFGDEARWRELLADQPMGRAAEPAEVASVVAFLASERASFVSGTIVTVDAGRAARGARF
ncbi:MAG: SDR family NAD(P)-dependent oxidoreductase [Proteobacteria bacterium]|nr:SDR family NAD(P)-dependent oxidoreductase [Pseudomonadota bacterium]